MRALLFWLTGFLPCRLINDGDRPYLERYFVARAFGVTVYLHRFVGDDPDRGLHDHPWSWALSLILAGYYYEERRGYGGVTLRPVRWVNLLAGDSFHRVLLPAGKREAWTLFVHGAYAKDWGFLRFASNGESHGVGRGAVNNPAMCIWRRHNYRTDERSGKVFWWHRAPTGRKSARMLPEGWP